MKVTDTSVLRDLSEKGLSEIVLRGSVLILAGTFSDCIIVDFDCSILYVYHKCECNENTAGREITQV